MTLFLTLKATNMAKCFKCEKTIICAVVSDVVDDVWSMPCNAVHFHGGSNFGSSIYDSMADGIAVEILVCDECLTAAKNTDKLREVKVERAF